MPRKNLNDLPMPKREYRIDKRVSPHHMQRFESEAEALAEDERRRASLYATCNELAPSEATWAEDLANRLFVGPRDKRPPMSLASMQMMREHRIKIIGHLVQACELFPADEVGFVTLMPRSMMVKSEDLFFTDPRLFMKRLRNDLDRAGVTKADGMLFAGLDCEFDENRGVYDFHFHAIAAGDKLKALGRLRDRTRYRRYSSKFEPLEVGLKPKRRIQIDRGPLRDMPTPIAYCLKSAIFHRPTSPTETGGLERSKRCFRVPEPHHARWLIWLDQWNLDDITIRSGLRFGRNGFKVSKKSEFLCEVDGEQMWVLMTV